MQMTKIRIRSTGQVLEMIPNVARAMIASGAGELVVDSEAKIETASVDQSKIEAASLDRKALTTDAPAQEKQKRKPSPLKIS
jgi:hypothetical protein